MPSVKIHIDKKKPKKDGTCAIYLVVNINYQSLKFATGVSCTVEDWDNDNKRVSGKSKQVKDDNLIIEKCLARMNDIFVRYRLQGADLTADNLRNEWKNPARRVDFFKFFEEALAENKHSITYSTYRHHKSAMSIIQQYRPKLAFSEITPDFIENLQRWLKKTQKNDVNTIHGKMRILRSYLYIAVRKGIIPENPFKMVKLKKASVNRVSLNESELKILWEVYNKKSLSESRTKVLRHFLFMCFTGVRISDLRSFTRSNIIGSTLVFSAFKTREIKRGHISIPLNSYAMQLISDEGDNQSPKLFKTISEQKMNEIIKPIASECGIEKEVTNHTARHTFATLWLAKTHDLAQLQVLLGHADITTTMMYVHISEEETRQQMNVFQQNLFDKKKGSAPAKP